jgi:hypothetical protein
VSKLDLSGEVKVTLERPPDPDPDAPNPEQEKEAKEGRVAVAAALAAGMTVLVAALGLFGGLTGSVARMARNDPWWTGFAVVAVIVSVALAIAARLVAPSDGLKRTPVPKVQETRRPYWSTTMLWVSAFLLAVGLIVAVVKLTATIGKDDRPSVSAQSTRDATTGVASLSGTAKAGGLAADDAIRVVVVAYAEGETDEGTQLYYAVVGPNPDGMVDNTFTVILPTGARSVVITAGKDPANASGVPGTCQPEASIDVPVDPADPVVVSGEDETLTACALVSVPAPPPPPPPPTSTPEPGDRATGNS